MTERPSPSPEQALTDAESALARGVVSKWDGLNSEAPRLDPDEPRRSAAELCLLAQALGQRGDPPRRPELVDPPRAGYQTGIHEGTPVSWPAFAAALTLDDRETLEQAAEELWAVDAALYSQVATAPRASLARHWLTSPGRRLLQDLGLLSIMAAGRAEDGATDLGWERLLDAAGARSTAPSVEHAAIHAAWPGASLQTWKPVDAVHALYTLEQGWPAHARGGALCWLLRMAASEPVVSLAGVRRHLGDELPGRLAVAFSKEAPAARVASRMAEIEALCLTHAARIARAHGREREVEATWHLARWIQTTTWASPFYGGDLESLAARLRALLPVEPSLPVEPPPPLAPARFGAGVRARAVIDLTEHAWASAAAEHYPDAERGLRPVPQPLIDGLRAIAVRALTGSECRLEGSLHPDDPHVAPPLIARRTLSEGVRASWLGALAPEAGAQLVEMLDVAPGRLRWLAIAALDDGDAAAPELAGELLTRWRQSEVLGAWEAEERCALAVGLAMHWQQGDAACLLAQLIKLPAEAADMKMALVRQFVLRVRTGDAQLRELAITALVTDAETAALAPAARVEALGVVLPWLADLDGPARDPLLGRVRRLAEQRPFRDSVPLRRELRRLGLGAT